MAAAVAFVALTASSFADPSKVGARRKRAQLFHSERAAARRGGRGDWLSHQRRKQVERGAQLKHLPALISGAHPPGSPTFVLIHGLSESPHGMREVGEIYGRYGNVFSIVLNGHGIDEQALDAASRRSWYGNVRASVRYARQRFGDNIHLVGFSIGGVLAVIHQLQAAPADQVRGVALHSPVLFKGDAFTSVIAEGRQALRNWQLQNPLRRAQDFPAYFAGSEGEYTLRTPLSVFEQVDGLTSDFPQALELRENNAAIERVVATGARLGVFYSKRDPKIHAERLGAFTDIAERRKADLVVHHTEDKMKHEETVRRSSRPGIIEVTRRRSGGPSSTIETTRADSIEAFVADFVSQN